MSSASCDDSSGVNFSYTPLRPEKSEIRLLRAQPGKLDAEIQPFDLHNISLNDYPSYIALSYTWGDPTPREIIYVNGKALLVTENLSRILKRAKEFEGSYFWVDGICINQAEIPERSCQVDAMPRIYSSAVKVVAFIGDAPDAVAGAARKLFMDPFLDCKTDEEFKVRSTDIREGRYKDTEASTEEVLEQWFSTIKVNSQPWFNRCWIVQEVLLAKEVEIWFGNMSFPMRNLYYGRESAWEYRLKSHGMETVFALQDHSTTINMDIALANLNNVHINKLLVAWTEWSERKDGRNTLFRLLQRFGGRSTTDARDRIYGLLGLASEKDQAAILPDYSELNKPSAVFRTVASHIIRTYEDPLEILYFACPPYDQTSKRPAHLLRGYERVSAHLSDILAAFDFSGIHAPLELSWVPTWEHTDRNALRYWQFRCAGETKADIRWEPNPTATDVYRHENQRLLPSHLRLEPARWQLWLEKNLPQVLSIRGTVLGKLSTVTSARVVDLPHLFGDISTGSGFQRVGRDKSQQQMLELVVKTLACDIFRSPDVSITQKLIESNITRVLPLEDQKHVLDEDQDMEVMERMQEAYTNDTTFSATMAVVDAVQVGRELGVLAFDSEDRHSLGTFPIEAVEGDTVVLFLGANMPFVLRPDSSFEYRNAECWRLIGECYIDGIMDGEIVEHDEATGVFSFGKSPLQDFVIV